jgi:hypothetical protein
MTKIQKANTAAMVIGLIGIAFGLYQAITGSPLKAYLFNLFIGICLFGTALLNNKGWKKGSK